MTLDEAILHAREVAVRNRKQYKNYPSDRTDIRYQTCEECAEEHEQLAEWLELLKWYQQGMEDIPSESGVLPKDVYHAGYNKAIDDFVNQFNVIVDEKCGTDTNNYFRKIIKEIAEQLKTGGENEQR